MRLAPSCLNILNSHFRTIRARAVQPNISTLESRAAREKASGKMAPAEVQTFDYIVIGGGSGGSGAVSNA